MKTGSTLGITLVAAALLAGCQSMQLKGGPEVGTGLNPDCPKRATPVLSNVVCLQNGVACGVAVEVVTDAGGACVVSVGTDILQMRRDPANPTAETTIYWWLAGSPDWEFRAEATPFTAPVIFKDPAANAQFKPSVVFAAGHMVQVQNRNQDKKKYEYKIRVFKKGGSGPGLDSPDPAIVNDFN